MKIRITALLCTMALLLTGCGGSAQVEAETMITEIVETTEPTEVTTVVTEPTTVFEKLGLTLWENCRKTGDRKQKMNCGKYTDFGTCVYGMRKGEKIEENLVDAELYVAIWEFPVAEFATKQNGKEILDVFYKADHAKDDASKDFDGWIAANEEYIILRANISLEIQAKESLANFAEMGADSFGASIPALYLVDMNSGRVFIPQTHWQVGRFTIEDDTENIEVFALSDIEHIPQYEDQYQKGWHSEQNIYVMVPAIHDSLAFCYMEFIDFLDVDGEQQTADNIDGWVESNLEDQLQELHGLKPYFFNYFY